MKLHQPCVKSYKTSLLRYGTLNKIIPFSSHSLPQLHNSPVTLLLLETRRLLSLSFNPSI